MSDENNGSNVVDFSSARKSASKKPDKEKLKHKNGGGNGSKAAYDKALKSRQGGGGHGAQVKWYHYVQTIGLLLLVAWMMKSCQ